MDEITKHHYRNIATGNAKKNKDGSLSTVSTRQVDLLDETGKRVPTLIPSIWDGEMLSEEEAVKKAKASGKKWPTAKTHTELRKFDIKIHEDMKPIPAESAASALEEAEVRESASAAKEFVTGGVVPMNNMDKPADKAREQMRSMGLSAPFIGSKETRTEEEVMQDRKTLAENVPILGEAIIAKEIVDDVKDENYLSAGLNTLALGVGAIPGAGDILNKPIRAAAKKLRKVDKDAATKMLSDIDSIETWKKQNPNPKPQKQNPDIEKSASDLLEGKITGKQHRSVVKENMPIVKIDEVPEMPSFTEIVGALDKDKSAKGILGLNKSVKDGTRVSSRLDIPAYERFDKWVVSVHDAFDKKGRESLNGDIVGYGKTAILKNVDFKGLPQGAANIAAKRNPKGTIARIFGDYYNAEPENVAEYAKQVIKNKNWTQVGYNPFRHGFFYDKNTGMPVKSAEEVIQVGPLVLAKNAKKIKISEAKQVGPKGGLKIRTGKPIEGLQNLKETKTVFNKGGVVPMNSMAKQMEMFETGGLMDEGGTVDPVSGNDVPPGSNQEEVRDDIPAQLSEGEFVFPADVVRYFGLERLMEMRQEAKMGLQRMEDMGQMGNSEEAIMPDNLPFDIDDLDIEEDEEYNMSQGGTVYAANGAFVPQQTGVARTAVQAASANPQLRGTRYTPNPVKTQTPTFQETVGPGVIGVNYEMVEYVNATGQTILLRRDKTTGQMLDTIPEGFTLKSEQTKSDVTTPTTVETAQVTDTGYEGKDEDVPSGATIAFGGNLNEKGLVDNAIRGTVSYRGANYLTGPLGLGGLQDVKGLLGRSLSSGINQMTGGKMGTPMSLKPGESIVIENMIKSRPGVNRSTALSSGIGLEVDDEFYNAHISGGTVTGRKTLEKVANYLNDNYKGLGKGSVINASQILSEIEKEEKRQARKDKIEAAQRLSGEARDRAFGVQDPSSPTGYTEGSVISDAIAEANADEAAAKARDSGDTSGFGVGGREASNFGGNQNEGGPSDPSPGTEGGMADAGDVGYGSGTDCLTEDMQVKLNGVVDFVTNVKVGDMIDNYKVKEVLHKHMREGYYSINNELKISNDHPVLANGTWTRPEDLVVGDSINGISVSSLEYVEQLTPTVSIVIDGESFDVHTENNIYTVHGRYREVRQEAA